jgi:hypothetical protein
VHTVPFSVNTVGATLAPLHEPLKPPSMTPFWARLAFHEKLVMLTCWPVWTNTPPQPSTTRCVPAKSHCRFQPLSGSPRLVMINWVLNPTSHWLWTM